MRYLDCAKANTGRDVFIFSLSFEDDIFSYVSLLLNGAILNLSETFPAIILRRVASFHLYSCNLKPITYFLERWNTSFSDWKLHDSHGTPDL